MMKIDTETLGQTVGILVNFSEDGDESVKATLQRLICDRAALCESVSELLRFCWIIFDEMKKDETEDKRLTEWLENAIQIADTNMNAVNHCRLNMETGSIDFIRPT